MIYISKAGDGIKIVKEGKTRVLTNFKWEYAIDADGRVSLTSDTTTDSVLSIAANYDELTIDGVVPTSAADALDKIEAVFTTPVGDTIINNITQGDTLPTELIFVEAVGDLPDASGGVITLGANKTYFFTTSVDLAGARLVGSANTNIIGGSSESCWITSTGLSSGTALISSGYSLPIRNVTISHGTALNLDATGNGIQALDWFGVNFTNCATIGLIKNYDNFIMTDSAFLNSSGLTFDGTINTAGALSCLFNANGGTIFTIPSTCTIGRRFRLIYSSFVILSGEVGIDVSTSASVPVEGFILDTINFSGGGEYIKTTGVQYSDNKALFINCKGVSNSASIGGYYMTGNATATDVTAANAPVKIAGTTTANGINQKFSHSNNRLTYAGALTRTFEVSVVLNMTGANSVTHSTWVYKNGVKLVDSVGKGTTNTGGRAENVACQTFIELATNDYIEVWTQTDTGTTDPVVVDLNVQVITLN